LIFLGFPVPPTVYMLIGYDAWHGTVDPGGPLRPPEHLVQAVAAPLMLKVPAGQFMQAVETPSSK
jgi:hypothetical protein